MNFVDWFPWVVLMVLAVGVQIWTPRKPHPNHEHVFRMTRWLGEQEHGDEREQR